MNVSLTPELEALIQTKVSSGLYNNASEVIREALRLLLESDETKALKKELLRRELAVGLNALDQGEFANRSLQEIRATILGSQEGK